MPDIIAIGCSAGGANALSMIVGALPAHFPASLLVVQHLPPAGPGVLPHILQRAGPLAAGHAKGR